MNTDPEFSPGRDTAIRSLLVETAAHTTPEHQFLARAGAWTSATRRRLLIGAATLTGLGVAGGVAAIATGALVLPGDTATTTQSTPVVATGSGTVNLDLGPVPEDATHVAVELTCLTSGYFAYNDMNILSCMGPSGGLTGTSYWPLEDGNTSLQIQTMDSTQWRLVASYVLRETTEWETNTNGETYGVPNENGFPDLMAANTAADGAQGYVYVEELYGTADPQADTSANKELKDKPITVPMYDQNGETVLGEFTVTIR